RRDRGGGGRRRSGRGRRAGWRFSHHEARIGDGPDVALIRVGLDTDAIDDVAGEVERHGPDTGTWRNPVDVPGAAETRRADESDRLRRRMRRLSVEPAHPRARVEGVQRAGGGLEVEAREAGRGKR